MSGNESFWDANGDWISALITLAGRVRGRLHRRPLRDRPRDQRRDLAERHDGLARGEDAPAADPPARLRDDHRHRRRDRAARSSTSSTSSRRGSSPRAPSLGLVLGLAARQVLANPLAGILLAISQPIRIGDTVTIEGETGRVDDLTLSHTFIDTGDGRLVIVPNETVVTNVVVNRSTGDLSAPVMASVWVPPDGRPRGGPRGAGAARALAGRRRRDDPRGDPDRGPRPAPARAAPAPPARRRRCASARSARCARRACSKRRDEALAPAYWNLQCIVRLPGRTRASLGTLDGSPYDGSPAQTAPARAQIGREEGPARRLRALRHRRHRRRQRRHLGARRRRRGAGHRHAQAGRPAARARRSSPPTAPASATCRARSCAPRSASARSRSSCRRRRSRSRTSTSTSTRASTTARSSAPRSRTSRPATSSRAPRRSPSSSCATSTSRTRRTRSSARSSRPRWRCSTRTSTRRTRSSSAISTPPPTAPTTAARRSASRRPRRSSSPRTSPTSTSSRRRCSPACRRRPRDYNPFNNPKGAKHRRNEVLDAMAEPGLRHRSSEAQKAKDAALELQRGYKYESRSQQYFFDFVQQELIDKYGLETAREGGLKVYTTLDPHLQQVAENAIAAHPVTGAAEALVSIDADTGEIKAMASSESYEDEPVQPRRPGPPPARLLVQALRAGRGGRRGHRSRDAPTTRRRARSRSSQGRVLGDRGRSAATAAAAR